MMQDKPGTGMMAKENNIFKMFRRAKEGYATLREECRLIERERAMLDIGKIVLVSEFNACMSGSGESNRKTFLEDMAQRRDSLFWQVFHHKAGQSGFFLIPFEKLNDRSRLSFKGKSFSSVDIESVLSQNPDEQENPGLCRYVRIMDLFLAPYPALQDNNSFLIPHISFEAVPLDFVIDCWDDTKNNFFGKAECGALLRGQGKAVIDFWKAVNGLSDYSYLFPKSRHYGGHGRREKEKERSSAPVLIPVLGGV